MGGWVKEWGSGWVKEWGSGWMDGWMDGGFTPRDTWDHESTTKPNHPSSPLHITSAIDSEPNAPP